MKRLLGMGNALVDALINIESEELLRRFSLPKGSMQLLDTQRYAGISRSVAHLPAARATGGSACNTVLALARLGMATGLIGKVSDDENGRFFAERFRRSGVELRLLRDTLPTGVATTFITPDGQRTFGTYLGAAARLAAEELRGEWFRGNDYFYIEGYLVQNHALIRRAVELAHEAGARVCLDMASYNVVEADRDFFRTLLREADIAFANEEEARALTGKAPREALDELAGLCPVAVVKTGAGGAIARRGEEYAESPANDVARVVDTTGAGDFFAAGFLFLHAGGGELSACLDAGNLLGGQIIQTVGTALSDDAWQAIRDALPKAK